MHGDDDDGEVMVDPRQLKAAGEIPPGGFPPSAPSATLKQRLTKKLSAIPAYLQPHEDPDSLRLASAEPSSSSLSGWAFLALLCPLDLDLVIKAT